jgi:hypothetical protein
MIRETETNVIEETVDVMPGWAVRHITQLEDARIADLHSFECAEKMGQEGGWESGEVYQKIMSDIGNDPFESKGQLEGFQGQVYNAYLNTAKLQERS